jgi:hypothetical protein
MACHNYSAHLGSSDFSSVVQEQRADILTTGKIIIEMQKMNWKFPDLNFIHFNLFLISG